MIFGPHSARTIGRLRTPSSPVPNAGHPDMTSPATGIPPSTPHRDFPRSPSRRCYLPAAHDAAERCGGVV